MPTDTRSGNREDFLHFHEAEAARAAQAPGPARDRYLANLFDPITETKLLLFAAEQLVRHGGPAAGSDDISPTELDQGALIALVRRLRQELRAGRYRPAPDRAVHIPKGPGRGTRTLSLPVVADRVVQRAILLAIQPYIDPQFVPTSFGGRPRLSTADAFVAAEKVMRTTGHRVVAVADIKKAFDSVPLDGLTACIRRWFGATAASDLLTTVVTTGRTAGVRQGGALSMLLLNLYLHDHLDRPMLRTHPEWTLIRWVDDLILITPTKEEAQRALNTVNDLLHEAGSDLKIKDETRIGDLAQGDTVEWLGLSIGSNADGITMEPSTGRWNDLREEVNHAHEEDCPTRHARTVTNGWINALEPVPPTNVTINRVLAILEENELHGTTTPTEMLEWWLRAHKRYQEKRLEKRKEITAPEQDWGETEEPTAPHVRIS